LEAHKCSTAHRATLTGPQALASIHFTDETNGPFHAGGPNGFGTPAAIRIMLARLEKDFGSRGARNRTAAVVAIRREVKVCRRLGDNNVKESQCGTGGAEGGREQCER
jgi:hypothetical protein